MRMRDWDERGLQPAFGHQGEWLSNMLDRAWSPEVAAYALDDDGRRERERPDRRSARGAARGPESGADGAKGAGATTGRARRFLVAAGLGLLDARFTPGRPADARLEAKLIPWTDVRGLELLTETTLDEAFRHRIAWRMRLAEPPVEIGDPASDAALLELWHEVALRAGRPPFEEPRAPE